MKRDFGYLGLILIACVLMGSLFRDSDSSKEQRKMVPKPASRDSDLSRKLHINELQLGMSRDQVNLLPSMLDGRKLGDTHQSDDSREMFGHIRYGVNSCSRVEFSEQNRLAGIRGLNLFFEGKPVEAKPDGTIPALGEPRVFTNSKGVRVVEYPQYSLKVRMDRDGVAHYTLGSLDETWMSP